jgi:hypothetical protein
LANGDRLCPPQRFGADAVEESRGGPEHAAAEDGDPA